MVGAQIRVRVDERLGIIFHIGPTIISTNGVYSGHLLPPIFQKAAFIRLVNMLAEDTKRLEKIDKLYSLRLDQCVSLPMVSTIILYMCLTLPG